MTTTPTIHRPLQRNTFEAMIAAFDEPLLCEMTTQAGVRCRRTAHWRLDLHGCEQALLCGQHAKAWERRPSLDRASPDGCTAGHL
jgi:hypothetical protein